MVSPEQFRALILEERDGSPYAALRELPIDALPDGDVLIAVSYSSLNYKDALAVTGKGKVVRSYPMVPGIDLAGTVVESRSPQWQPGTQVILTGWEVGERYWGGFAEYARVRGEWLVALPPGLTPREAMGLGTAGLTAMLCIMALEERGLLPGGRPVAVTGAGGGVGSVAVALLAHLGYAVAASTGREELRSYLTDLGANQILDRSVLANPAKPLGSEQWDGAVDTVGGTTLAGLLATMSYGSSVAACGLAGGHSLQTTVFPFILRGVSLLGIDSVHCPTERRRGAWARLAADLPHNMLDRIIQEIRLEDIQRLSESILAGQVRGRTVIAVHG